MIAPQPKKTRANVPAASAASRRAPGLPSRSDCHTRLGKERTHAFERSGLEAVVRECPTLLAVEQPSLDELLQVVAHRRLRDTEQGLDLAHTDRLPARLQQAVEDLQPMPVGERLE